MSAIEALFELAGIVALAYFVIRDDSPYTFFGIAWRVVGFYLSGYFLMLWVHAYIVPWGL